MTKVLAGGVFDLLHKGHEHFLSEAKKLGDKLVVVVTNDTNVDKIELEHDEEIRAENMRKLGIADEVLIGYAGKEFMRIVKDVKPDIIALGYDQELPVPQSEVDKLKIRVIRIPELEGYSSSKLRST